MANLKDQETTIMEVDYGGNSGCIIHDTIWITGGGSSLRGFDIFTGTERVKENGEPFYDYGEDFSVDPSIVGSFNGNLVMISQNGKLYFGNPDNSDLIKVASPGFSTWIQEAGGFLFVNTNEGVFKYDANGSKVASYEGGQSRGNPCISGDYLYYAYYSSYDGTKIKQLSLSDLSVNWERNVNGIPDTDLATDGKFVYYGTKSFYYGAIEIATGKKAWEKSFSGTQGQDIIKAQPAVGNDVVVFSNSEAEKIYFKQPSSGSSVKVDGSGNHVLDEGDPYGKTLISDGILYVGTSGHVIYAVDLETGNELVYDGAGYIIDIRDGILYATGGKTIGLNFAEILREFYAETQLVQDYKFEGSGDPELLKTYSTEISLTYPDGSPREDTIVRIWTNRADVDSTITISNKDYVVNLNDYAQVTTDANGKVRVSIPADSLSSPTLFVWASFMNENEHIVIYPDAQVHEQLANLQLTNEEEPDKGLKNAVDFAGNSILLPDYEDDDETLQNVVSAINSTMGMTSSSKNTRSVRNEEMTSQYLAEGCDIQTISCCDKDNSECQIVCRESFFFSLDKNGGDFQTVSTGYATLTTDRAQSLASEYEQKLQGQVDSRNLFDDGWDLITDAGSEVVDFMVYIEEEAEEEVKAFATAIVEGVETVVELVVETIEHAVKLVEAIVELIVESIEKFIEFLSFLFDWDRIIAIHQKIASQFTTVIHTMTDENNTDLMARVVDGTLDALSEDVESFFDSLKNAVEGKSTNDQQQTVTEESGKDNSAEGGAKQNWLTQKLADNSGEQSGDTGSQETRSTSSIGISLSLDEDDPVYDAVTVFLNDIEESISETTQNTLLEYQEKWKFDTSSDFASAALDEVLTIVEDFTEILISILKDTTDSSIALLPEMGDAIIDILNSKIEIPFISDLYSWLVGEDLTLGNLIALFAAVGIVLEEELRGQELFDLDKRDASFTLNQLTVTGSILQIVSGPLIGLSSVLDVNNNASLLSFLKWLDTGCRVVSRAFLFAQILEKAKEAEDDSRRDAEILLWCYPTFGVCASMGFLISGQSKINNLMGQSLDCAFGFAHFSAVNDMSSQEDFSTEEIVFYSLAGIPLFIKPIRNWKPYGLGIDVIISSLMPVIIGTWRMVKSSNQSDDRNTRETSRNTTSRTTSRRVQT